MKWPEMNCRTCCKVLSNQENRRTQVKDKEEYYTKVVQISDTGGTMQEQIREPGTTIHGEEPGGTGKESIKKKTRLPSRRKVVNVAKCRDN